MSDEKACFIDTNILLYLLSEDETKTDASEAVIADGGTISVHVLLAMCLSVVWQRTIPE